MTQQVTELFCEVGQVQPADQLTGGVLILKAGSGAKCFVKGEARSEQGSGGSPEEHGSPQAQGGADHGVRGRAGQEPGLPGR